MSVNIYQESSIRFNSPTILDIGCSTGLESWKLYQIFKPCKIISVDLCRSNINETNRLIIQNELQHIWTTCLCAVDNEEANKEIVYLFSPAMYNRACGFLLDDHNKDDLNLMKDVVLSRKLLSICPNPDIIKVDIEGHEWKIWDQLIESKASLMFIELHSWPHLIVYNQKEKLQQMEKRYNVHYYKYAQAQNIEFDYTEELTKEQCLEAGYYHILCELK